MTEYLTLKQAEEREKEGTLVLIASENFFPKLLSDGFLNSTIEFYSKLYSADVVGISDLNEIFLKRELGTLRFYNKKELVEIGDCAHNFLWNEMLSPIPQEVLFC